MNNIGKTLHKIKKDINFLKSNLEDPTKLEMIDNILNNWQVCIERTEVVVNQC